MCVCVCVCASLHACVRAHAHAHPCREGVELIRPCLSPATTFLRPSWFTCHKATRCSFSMAIYNTYNKVICSTSQWDIQFTSPRVTCFTLTRPPRTGTMHDAEIGLVHYFVFNYLRPLGRLTKFLHLFKTSHGFPLFT